MDKMELSHGLSLIKSVILIFIIVFISLSFYEIFNNFHSLFSPKHIYTYNITFDKILGNITEVSPFQYTIGVFNDSSVCAYTVDIGNFSEPTYSFTSTSLISNTPISYFENKHDAFILEAKYYGSDSNSNIVATFLNPDVLVPKMNYDELPKLTQDFSVNFDLPVFNRSKFQFLENSSENKVIAHIELPDNWGDNYSFVCQFRRSFNSEIDNSTPLCGTKSSAFISMNVPCFTPSYNCSYSHDHINYMVKGNKNGRNIDCVAPASDFTNLHDYDIRILIFQNYSGGLFKFYVVPQEEFSNILIIK